MTSPQPNEHGTLRVAVVTPMIAVALIAAADGRPWLLSLFVVVACFVGGLIVGLGPETRGRRLDALTVAELRGGSQPTATPGDLGDISARCLAVHRQKVRASVCEPAVIEYPDTTVVLLTGNAARVDHFGNLIINIASRHDDLALKGA